MKKLALAFLVMLVCLLASAAFAQTDAGSNEITITVPVTPAPAPPAEPPAPTPTPAVGQTPSEWAGQTAEPAAQPAAEPPKEEPKAEPKPEPKPEPKAEPKAAGDDNKRLLHANIKLNWWVANFDGTLKFAHDESVGGTTVSVGDNINIEKQFDIQNPMDVYEFEAWVALGKMNRLMVDYFSITYGGDNTLNQTLSFAGSTFKANSDVTTRVNMTRIGLLSDFLPLNGDIGNFGLRYGIEYFIWQISVKGTEDVTGKKIDESQYLPAPIPVIGLAGNLYLPYGFGVYGSFVGIGGEYQGIGGSYTDLDVGLSWSWKYLYTGVGYRSLRTIVNYKTDSDEIHLDTVQSGILGSVGLAL